MDISEVYSRYVNWCWCIRAIHVKQFYFYLIHRPPVLSTTVQMVMFKNGYRIKCSGKPNQIVHRRWFGYPQVCIILSVRLGKWNMGGAREIIYRTTAQYRLPINTVWILSASSYPTYSFKNKCIFLVSRILWNSLRSFSAVSLFKNWWSELLAYFLFYLSYFNDRDYYILTFFPRIVSVCMSNNLKKRC
jgi:hypothetical protein